jgi:hypothetical protein
LTFFDTLSVITSDTVKTEWSALFSAERSDPMLGVSSLKRVYRQHVVEQQLGDLDDDQDFLQNL